MPQILKRYSFLATGIVQGVGFRPFIYNLAETHNLSGFVQNTDAGVVIEVQGKYTKIVAFKEDLINKLPPLAKIDSFSETELETSTISGFVILKSQTSGQNNLLVSPDIATCPNCLQDIRTKTDRRFAYALTNCTNCGPRYSLIKDLPYDRINTAMAKFKLCNLCQAEYNNPKDRRFHAQPTACPTCGPNLYLTDNSGKILENTDFLSLKKAALELSLGKIVAIKGLGGFLLACDAQNSQTITTLRQKKHRPHKPLAIMLPDIITAKQLVHLNPEEEKLLSSISAPILLCRKKQSQQDRPVEEFAQTLAPELTYALPELGIMLPYTPLHHLLFDLYKQVIPASKLPVLVMTSGNLHGEPICRENTEALHKLKDIADFFLLHDRDIITRVDDSVAKVLNPDSVLFYRRARGFSPTVIKLENFSRTYPNILGVGAELKNTICLSRGNKAFISQHIGDLTYIETELFFEQTLAHLKNLLKIEPELIVTDLHPDYYSGLYAKNTGLPILKLQHHAAHIFSVLAENNYYEQPVLGLSLDGSGLGQSENKHKESSINLNLKENPKNNKIWGGELLLVNPADGEWQRIGSLMPFALPGGDKAAFEPWRMTMSLLFSLHKGQPKSLRRPLPWQEQDLIWQMLKQNLNCPLSSSCGRLFDGVAALLGFNTEISYEGQAAVYLEHLQNKEEKNFYPCSVQEKNDFLYLDSLELFAACFEDWQNYVSETKIAKRFHLGLIHGLLSLLKTATQKYQSKTIALSGGVFQNASLSTILPFNLQQAGFKVLQHKILPPNDASISLGQVAFARCLKTWADK